MHKRKISAKELAGDIKSGMRQADLLKKYNILSFEKLEGLCDKLIGHGLIDESNKEKLFKKFSCPACGHAFSEFFSECPACGIIVSKYKKKDDQTKSVLQECSVCGGKISKNAAICPHCGEPNSQNIVPEDDTKKITRNAFGSVAGKVLGWFFGVVFILAAIGAFFTSNVASGFSYLLAGVVLTPPLMKKFKINLSTKAKFISVFALIMVGGILQDTMDLRRNDEPEVKVHYSTKKDTAIDHGDAHSSRKSRFFPDLNNIERVQETPSTAYSDRRWYQDGDLHDKTVNDWKSATYANKLATSADMATASQKVKAVISQSGSVDAMKPFAVELMTCINEAAAGQGYENMKVAELAAGCMILMKW